MRVTDEQRTTILRLVRDAFGEASRVMLFGSRVDVITWAVGQGILPSNAGGLFDLIDYSNMSKFQGFPLVLLIFEYKMPPWTSPTLSTSLVRICE